MNRHTWPRRLKTSPLGVPLLGRHIGLCLRCRVAHLPGLHGAATASKAIQLGIGLDVRVLSRCGFALAHRCRVVGSGACVWLRNLAFLGHGDVFVEVLVIRGVVLARLFGLLHVVILILDSGRVGLVLLGDL
jgi:hypothetical protein